MKLDLQSKAAVAERVKIARNALGMTQLQFAKAIGASLPTVKNYEGANRIPGGKVLGGFARAGVNVDWLLNGTGGPPLYARSDAGLKYALSEFPNPEAAREQLRRIRDASDLLQRLQHEMGCDIPSIWGGTLLDLVATGQITEIGVRRILWHFKVPKS